MRIKSLMIFVAVFALTISVLGAILRFAGSIRILDDMCYLSRKVNKYEWEAGKYPDIDVILDEGTINVAQSADGRVSAILVSAAETKVSQELANTALDDLVISATHQADAIRLRTTKTLKAGVRGLKADLELRVPPGANLNLLTGDGSIIIGKYRGGSYGTDLISSPVMLNSLKAKDMGKIHVGIEVDIAPGPSLDATRLALESKNGSICIKGSNVLVNARSEIGGIEFIGRLAPGVHQILTNTYSYHSDETWRIRDGIKITLPANCVFELDAASPHGNVTSEFFKEFSDSPIRHIFKGTFGTDPRIRLELRSNDGPIAVQKSFQ